jgi:hypothetical protein
MSSNQRETMKQILLVAISTLVFILTMPLAYGQQPQPLDNSATTDLDTTMNQNVSTANTTTTTTTTPEATIGKSENLTITDVRFRAESYQITGTVTNNSTEEQASISIYAVFFDKDDSFIGLSQGRPLVESLPPGDNSPFSIDLFSGFDYSMPEEVNGIDHYTIYARGYEPLFGFMDSP